MITHIEKDMNGNVTWIENGMPHNYIASSETAQNAITRAVAQGLTVEEYSAPALTDAEQALADLAATDSKMSRPEEDSIIAQAWAGNPVADYSYSLAVQRRQLREVAVEGYVLYWWNRDSNLVHRTTCQHCDTTDMIPLESSEAVKAGANLCEVCNPVFGE